MDPLNEADFARLRRELTTRTEARRQAVGYMSPTQWAAASQEFQTAKFPAANRDVVLTACGRPMPSLGTEWSLLLALSLQNTSGYAWVMWIEGDIFFEHPVTLSEGNGEIPSDVASGLCALLSHGKLSAIRDARSDVYDGAPTEMHILRGAEHRVLSANASAPGRGRAVKLARLVWRIVDVVEAVETKKYSESRNTIVSNRADPLHSSVDIHNMLDPGE